MAIVFTDDTHYQNIAKAIREKNGLTTTYKPSEMSAAIKALNHGRSGSGGTTTSIKEKDVNFYDYDGALLHSYTLEAAQALTKLPALPTREGLTCQGWNYDLATIKSYNRKVNVGATYVTDDGKTRIYIKLEDDSITSPKLGVCPNGTVDVDWGDGTAHDTLTGTDTTVAQWTPVHNYASAGEYIIQLTVTGEMKFCNDIGIFGAGYDADSKYTVYQASIQKIEIGTGVLNIGNSTFKDCRSLLSIVLPNNVTDIGGYAFNLCYSLLSIVLPNSIVSIGSSAFEFCRSLKNIIMPNNVTLIDYATFDKCYSLENVIIPDSVTSIGDSAFRSCISLKDIVIPNNVTNIEYAAFTDCYALKNVTIPNSVTSIGDGAFTECLSLRNIVIPDSLTTINNSTFSGCEFITSIIIPDTVTSIGNSAFSACFALRDIIIPSSITTIEQSTFYYCSSLESIIIPNTVTNIGNHAFACCYNMTYYDFSTHTSIPTLGRNVFIDIQADCEIRVPAALNDEWIAATNWSTYASNIVAV